jgi:putative membrane-bound dehydrogenase-like protein
MKPTLLVFSLLFYSFSQHGLVLAQHKLPQCLDDAWTVELVAAEPEIVTPVGCRFDSKGRLFVIESHTHFPPEGYAGPPHDRIKILDDTNGDGKLDRVRVFHEGTRKTMGIAIDKQDRVYLVTRNTIQRLQDTDGDDVADTDEVLVKLETKADYPHNGMGGLLISPSGDLIFGLGENFGEPYTIAGKDGSQLSGGGEGGNVYRCSIDGGNLHWIATGLWNPFGMCFDDQGRLLAVENDPDASPPCRIVHVVQCGDYGFQFRFGRAGTHPLLSWNGELEGTMPMVAGTGEAPCAILPYRGKLWVTSWGDNRLESYVAQEQGKSIISQTQVSVLGDASFRPVDMAIAPDGSVYVTDWVDRSYNVHGMGRIWRLIPKQLSSPQATSEGDLTVVTEDPFAWQEEVAELYVGGAYRQLVYRDVVNPKQRLAFLAAWRWEDLVTSGRVGGGGLGEAERRQILREGLSDENEGVRLFAIRWAAERRVTELKDDLREMLKKGVQTRRELAAIAAAISYIETGKAEGGVRDAGTDGMLVSVVRDKDADVEARVAALELLGPKHQAVSQADLDDWIGAKGVSGGVSPLAIAAARQLAMRSLEDVKARQLAMEIALDSSFNETLRADCMVGWDMGQAEVRAKVQKLAGDRSSAVAIQAKRLLMERDKSFRTETALASDRFGEVLWSRAGDAAAGWRVFFSASARCSMCHAHAGRGASVGPDLTRLAGQMTPQRLLESMVHPSREIAPMYVPWKILTVDGRALTGLKLNGGGVGNRQRYLASDGSYFEVELAEIETQEPLSQSIMPEGLLMGISDDEIRDLMAFLIESKIQP